MEPDECHRIKSQFLRFMKERASFQNKEDLRISYEEFRRRNGGALPDFTSFFEAMKYFKMINIRGDEIDFNAPILNGVQNALPTAEEKRKVARDILQELESNRVHLVSDKNGISITSEPPFNKGILTIEGEFKFSRRLEIKNSGPKPVDLTGYFFLHQVKFLTLVDEHKVTQQSPLSLQPGASCEIQLDLHGRHVGEFRAEVAFEFRADPQTSSAPFYIVRFIEVHFVTSVGKKLRAVAKNTPRRRLVQRSTERYCENHSGYRAWLQWYPMNKKELSSLIFGPDESRHSALGKLLHSSLSWRNYTEKLQLLLHLEEFQMVKNNKRYNIPNATMKRHGKLLVLELPDLSESRLSVQPGDEVVVYPVGETTRYYGSVVSVQQESVELLFNSRLLARFQEDMVFRVEFPVNRLLLCIQHRAAVLASHCKLRELLFPDTRPSSFRRPQLTKLRLFDKRVRNNPEQYRAVQHIVAGSSMPAPHLVFGPPGTGKTVTLVEAIKQIEKTQDGCCILACAPNNSAADQLCRKILNSGDRHKKLRFYALGYNQNNVPENIKPYSNLRRGSFYCPTREELMCYRIIVTTVFTAGRLVKEHIPVGHFTHVFVDEAGQATEPQCLIPLAGLVRARCGQVVLAGDPKQLGPIVRSTTAKKHGLNVSLFERLLIAFSDNKSVDGVFNECFVTKLLCNYRSHPDILKVPSDLFYGGQLKPHADESRNDFCDWERLPQKGFPVIFYTVKGQDKCEADSPSYFNLAEVTIVHNYVKELLQSKDKNGSAIPPKDIGIIAPYRKQVKLIQRALETLGEELKRGDLSDLKVCTVEEFQGDERRIILVSTVRSNAEHLQKDEKFHMGLVTNEKRFNVALTRAKALLIVVGNPSILATKDNWKRFINFCKEKEGYYCHEDFEKGEEEKE